MHLELKYFRKLRPCLFAAECTSTTETECFIFGNVSHSTLLLQQDVAAYEFSVSSHRRLGVFCAD